MKFDDLDSKMRIFETSMDYSVLPGLYIVARLDGRSFTKLTKEKAHFEAPFDEKFRNLMTETTKHLMDCGFKIIYGYTESDEISLLFDRNIDLFSRKIRKYNSILAGEASAEFSLLFGSIGVFDCRICQLPTKDDVIDYFRWRNEDAHRNALNSHCYWTLRKEGQTQKQATEYVSNKTVSQKNELLFQHGINFNDIPNWQKRGIGLYWVEKEHIGINPLDNSKHSTLRKSLSLDYELPMGEAYSNFIEKLIDY